MAIDLNDVLRVVLTWDTAESTVAQLVWHYLVTAGNNDDPDDVLTAIDTNLDSAWANISSIVDSTMQGSLLELFQWDFTNNQWDGVANHIPGGVDGGAALEALPHGAAALCKFFTALNRRQSRKFIPSLGEGTQNDGLFTASALTSLALFALDFDDVISAPLTTLTYCTFNTDPTSALFETTSLSTQSVQAEAVVAYQRRRRPGTGI